MGHEEMRMMEFETTLIVELVRHCQQLKKIGVDHVSPVLWHSSG